jgi:hypothetical protein
VAQAALCFTLWGAGKRDLWLVYLVASLARSAVLWPLSGDAYYWVWLMTEVCDLSLRFAVVLTVATASRRPSNALTGLWVAVFFCTLAGVCTPAHWPIARQGRLMLFSYGAIIAAGVWFGALVGGAPPNLGISGYLILDICRVLGECLSAGRTGIEAVNMAYLWALAALLSACALVEIFPSKGVPDNG